jgi:serine/threonine protein kinase
VFRHKQLQKPPVCDAARAIYDALKDKEGTLFKINSRATDSVEEVAANDQIFEWTSASNILYLTPLHSEINHLVAETTFNEKVIVIVMRRLTGDVDKISMPLTDIIRMAWTTLTVTRVIHQHDHMHQDIKPKNVLHHDVLQDFERSRTFALADYGIMESMPRVYNSIKRGHINGTYGFMSPYFWFMCNDNDNQVYPTFREIIDHCRDIRKERDHSHEEVVYREQQQQEQRAAAAAAEDEGGVQLDTLGTKEMEFARLNNIFNHHKTKLLRTEYAIAKKTMLPKVDLHSIGLMLYAVLKRSSDWPPNYINSNDVNNNIMKGKKIEVLKDFLLFIEALLMYDENHFMTTDAALASLCSTFPDCRSYHSTSSSY